MSCNLAKKCQPKPPSLCWRITGMCSRGRIHFMWGWLTEYFTFSISSLLATLLYRFLISFNSISFPPVGSYSTFCTSWRAVNPALTHSAPSFPGGWREGSDLGAGEKGCFDPGWRVNLMKTWARPRLSSALTCGVEPGQDQANESILASAPGGYKNLMYHFMYFLFMCL